MSYSHLKPSSLDQFANLRDASVVNFWTFLIINLTVHISTYAHVHIDTCAYTYVNIYRLVCMYI